MLTVLIVEDDPMVAQINKNYLEKNGGFRTAGVVCNGAAALAFLEETPVSLLLLDVFMPGMDGLSLLRGIRDRHPAVDVIMVTAARGSDDIQAALRLGVIDYIVKPFTFERFQAALIAYQERLRLLRSDELDQDMLDKRIFVTRREAPALPKGIETTTLKKVREILAGSRGEFCIKEIVPLAGISRISLKKYFGYLEFLRCIESRLMHLPIGRPVTMYRWIGE